MDRDLWSLLKLFAAVLMFLISNELWRAYIRSLHTYCMNDTIYSLITNIFIKPQCQEMLYLKVLDIASRIPSITFQISYQRINTRFNGNSDVTKVTLTLSVQNNPLKCYWKTKFLCNTLSQESYAVNVLRGYCSKEQMYSLCVLLVRYFL